VRLSLRPPARMEQLGSNWREFNEIWYLNIFHKSVEKNQVLLIFENNNGYFTLRCKYTYLAEFL